MNGFIEHVSCRVCGSDVKYFDDEAFVDGDKVYIVCPYCMNEIKIKRING